MIPLLAENSSDLTRAETWGIVMAVVTFGGGVVVGIVKWLMNNEKKHNANATIKEDLQEFKDGVNDVLERLQSSIRDYKYDFDQMIGEFRGEHRDNQKEVWARLNEHGTQLTQLRETVARHDERLNPAPPPRPGHRKGSGDG